MTNRRFVLDSEEHVVDTSNSNPRMSHYCTYDTSEKALRESVLIRRINEFVDKLLVNKPFCLRSGLLLKAEDKES